MGILVRQLFLIAFVVHVPWWTNATHILYDAGKSVLVLLSSTGLRVLLHLMAASALSWPVVGI